MLYFRVPLLNCILCFKEHFRAVKNSIALLKFVLEIQNLLSNCIEIFLVFNLTIFTKDKFL